MNFYRVYGVLLRNLYLFKRSMDRMSDAFYWPTVDLVLWGLTSSFLTSGSENAPTIMLMVISGLLFWLIIYRGQLEISISLLEDLWNRNLVNMFASPLTFGEWIFAFMILAVGKSALSFVFGGFVAYFLYKVNIVSFGLQMLWYLIPLMMAAWWSGYFFTGLILRYGTRIQSFGWTLVWVVAPFSAVYYPVSALPEWAQSVAAFVPTSYIFEGMRTMITTGVFDTQGYVLSLVLNCVLLVITFVYLWRSFHKVLQKGLVKVY